ncbi:MAG: PIN domain-containing protein [Bacteroidetes bacterium]|nr:PIN domain-containing protein [Bacteroidota bacterium]
MKVLIDTNIILDFVLNREPFADDAAELFYRIEQETFSAAVSASAVTDIFYLLQKAKVDACAFLKEFLLGVDVLGVDKTIIMYALHSGWTDFEDAVQAQVAIENDVDVIVTRNTKDYKQLKRIQVLTPAELLQSL